MLAGQSPLYDTNIRAIYRRILYANLEFPWTIDTNAKDLIRSLLSRNPSKRIGCMTGQTIEDIKKHRWFKGIDWDQLRKRSDATFHSPFQSCRRYLQFYPLGRSIAKNTNCDYGNLFAEF